MPQDRPLSDLHAPLEDQLHVFELEDHVAVCAECGSRVALPYDTSPDWCCSIPCYRHHQTVAGGS